MEIFWDQIKQQRWETLADLAMAPMQQRWNYGAVHSTLGGKTLRAVVYKCGNPVAICQCVIRKAVGLLNISLATRGPLWIGPCDKKAVLKLIRRSLPVSQPRAQLFSLPETSKIPRLIPLMTPTTHAIANLPLGRGDIHGKWRNCLTKAQNNGLRSRHIACPSNRLLEMLKADHQQQIDKSYRALPAEFTLAWHKEAAGDLRLITVSQRGEIIASGLFICHGNTASYHIAHTTELGRKLSAQRLVLWRAFNDLSDQGIKQIDLGLIDTVNAAGLARFKLGTGATAQRLGPTVLAL